MSDKKFSCQYEGCGYGTDMKADLKKHINAVHLKIKTFQCDKCDYKCCLNGNLIKHIKAVHNKIKPFHCDICRYEFGSKSHLTRHIKSVHDKIKDHKCNKCNFKCSEKSDLTQHIKICTGKSNMSSGEFKVKQTLDEMKIKYNYNSSYEVKSEKSLLRWDFHIEMATSIYL